MPDILEVFKQNLKESKREQKSSDIVDFIRSNWRLFCSSSRHMSNVVEELEQQGQLTVDALADALELPDSLLFHRFKLVDAAGTVLDFTSSRLYKLFRKQLEKRRTGGHDPKLCLIAVAGARTLVITNMVTRVVAGRVRMYVPGGENGDDVELFPISDAQLRLPELFIHEENGYD